MKIWLLSDTHFGKYATKSNSWLEMMEDYFYNFYIPFLKKHAKPNDKFILLGDLFDNRLSINLKAINVVIKIFEELSQLIECHVLLGNHDQLMMKHPDINGISIIRNIDNVYTYLTPTTKTWDGKKIGIMPWLNDKSMEQETLKSFNGYDYVFCHSDLNGCRTQIYPTRPKNKSLLDIDDFKGINRVFSGHIHIRQTINNFTFVGTPYQLDRNDIDNRKGFYVVNLKNNDETFIENDYSPEFVKIKINKEKDIEKLKTELNSDKENYIDVIISKTLLINSPHIKLQLDKLTNKYRIKKIEQLDDVVKQESVNEKIVVNDKSLLDLSLDWANSLKFNKDIDFISELEFNKKIRETIKNCFSILNNSKN